MLQSLWLSFHPLVSSEPFQRPWCSHDFCPAWTSAWAVKRLHFFMVFVDLCCGVPAQLGGLCPGLQVLCTKGVTRWFQGRGLSLQVVAPASRVFHKRVLSNTAVLLLIHEDKNMRFIAAPAVSRWILTKTIRWREVTTLSKQVPVTGFMLPAWHAVC